MYKYKLLMIEETGQYLIGFGSDGNAITTSNPLKAKMYMPRRFWYEEKELLEDINSLEFLELTPVTMTLDYEVNRL